MLEIKNTVTEMKNVFDGPINGLDMAEKIISEFTDLSMVTPKTNAKKEKIIF